MNKIFLKLSLFPTILLIASCSAKETGADYSIGFVSEYASPDMMEITVRRTILEVDIWGSLHSYNDGKDAIYSHFAKKYSDTKYKSKLFPGSATGIAKELYGITVTCDSDIDPEHPAGNPLGDMVIMEGWTFLEYIQSGYKFYTMVVENPDGYPAFSRGDTGHTPFIKYLKDITPEDLILIKNKFNLYLSQDWPAGEYNLTITVYGEDFELSKRITCTVD